MQSNKQRKEPEEQICYPEKEFLTTRQGTFPTARRLATFAQVSSAMDPGIY